MFEREFSRFYSSGQDAPAKPIRLMAGLLILKHVRNLPDGNISPMMKLLSRLMINSGNEPALRYSMI
jgi:hypothetical protein